MDIGYCMHTGEGGPRICGARSMSEHGPHLKWNTRVCGQVVYISGYVYVDLLEGFGRMKSHCGLLC